MQIPLTSDSGPHTKLRTSFFCSYLWSKHEEGHKSEQKKQGSVTENPSIKP